MISTINLICDKEDCTNAFNIEKRFYTSNKKKNPDAKHFCSEACRRESSKKQHQEKCANCAKDILVGNNDWIKSTSKRFFCGRSCSAISNNLDRKIAEFSTKNKTKEHSCPICNELFVGSVHLPKKSSCKTCKDLQANTAEVTETKDQILVVPKKIGNLPYFDDTITVTGPYLDKVQNRKFVTYTLPDKNRTQKTYAKYLMEMHLSRNLSKEEEVDHIDRDKTNDVIGNLQVLSKSEHKRLDTRKAKPIILECALDGCDNIISKTARQLRMHQKAGYAGPFCGAVCRGKYGKQVQESGKTLPVQKGVDTELYYPNEKK